MYLYHLDIIIYIKSLSMHVFEENTILRKIFVWGISLIIQSKINKLLYILHIWNLPGYTNHSMNINDPLSSVTGVHFIKVFFEKKSYITLTSDHNNEGPSYSKVNSTKYCLNFNTNNV